MKLKKILAFLLLLSLFIPAFSEPAPVDLVFTNPSLDCSTGVRISFHAQQEKAVLLYTKAADTNFKKAKKIKCTGEYTPVEFHDGEEYYQFAAELKKLKANTEYIYKIVLKGYEDVDYESNVYSFSTADNDGEFGFLWISDVHTEINIPTRMRYADELADMAQTYLNGDMDLVVSSGDEVCYGAYYNNWQQWNGTFINKKIWADVPGNHTYYDVFKRGQDMVGPEWWDVTQNQPEDNPEGQPSSFWFLYDSILFIGIDSIDSSYTNQQKTWFKRVVEENEGRYQYLIVYQHYPYMNAFTGGFGGTDVSFFLWQQVFDDYGVDFALSGDSHVFIQTKPIFNRRLSKKPNEKGTVYIGAPQIGDRSREIQTYVNEELMENRITSSDLDGQSGISFFKVTKEGITYTLIDMSGEKRVETYYPARRPYPEKK